MSRLTTLSPNAIRAMFSTESQAALITLLTIYDTNGTTPLVRLADNFTKRIEGLTTVEEVIYGVTSNNQDYIFVPLEISLPAEQDNAAPKCSIVIRDVTRYFTATIRSLNDAPKIRLDMVLSTSPDVVEASFTNFFISNISYNADAVTAELSMIDFAVEPFPCYSFTPNYFPGMF